MWEEACHWRWVLRCKASCLFKSSLSALCLLFKIWTLSFQLQPLCFCPVMRVPYTSGTLCSWGNGGLGRPRDSFLTTIQWRKELPHWLPAFMFFPQSLRVCVKDDGSPWRLPNSRYGAYCLGRGKVPEFVLRFSSVSLYYRSQEISKLDSSDLRLFSLVLLCPCSTKEQRTIRK